VKTSREFLGIALLLAATTLRAPAAPATAPAAPEPIPLRTEYAFTAYVKVAAPLVVGQGPLGLRRFIPITGGTVSGPMLTGKVLAGAGDWQVIRADGVISLEARYTLETSDGVRLSVVNRGLRVASAEVTARMMRGDPVAAGEYYFRTAAEFEAPVGSRYDWLNKAIFIGVAERNSDAAIVHFYRVN
jgi:uncharacterized protein DUF3237